MVHPLIVEARQRRLSLCLTQAQVGEAMGVGQGYVSDVERGRSSPAMSTVDRYFAALGLMLTLKWAG